MLKEKIGIERPEEEQIYPAMDAEYFSVVNISIVLQDLQALVSDYNLHYQLNINIADLNSTNLCKCRALCSNNENVIGALYLRRFMVAKKLATSHNDAKGKYRIGIIELKKFVGISS